jgi:hypothetical protein
MEFEHQHERRLPDTDTEPNGYGFTDTSYANSDSNGHTSYPNSNTDNHTDTDPNGHTG